MVSSLPCQVRCPIFSHSKWMIFHAWCQAKKGDVLSAESSRIERLQAFKVRCSPRDANGPPLAIGNPWSSWSCGMAIVRLESRFHGGICHGHVDTRGSNLETSGDIWRPLAGYPFPKILDLWVSEIGAHPTNFFDNLPAMENPLIDRHSHQRCGFVCPNHYQVGEIYLIKSH